jgi:DUF4097 and DUF4098 domain-containing protein YvlB
MRMNRIICLVALVGICLVQTAESHSYFSTRLNPHAASLNARTGQNDFHWREQVAPGRAIEINGVYGNIHAEAASGNEVEVVATKHAVHSNPNEVQLQVIKHQDGVTICAVYPGGNQCKSGDMSSHVHNNDVRVDFTVRVPANVRLIARAVNGDIEAVSLHSNVEAYSAMGNVSISTDGYARARTITGYINASMGNAGWSGRLDFESVTGEITLKLPASTNTEVHAESITGNISTEFPLTVKGMANAQSLEGVIGSGGRRLTLKTISGPIKLMRIS